MRLGCGCRVTCPYPGLLLHSRSLPGPSVLFLAARVPPLLSVIACGPVCLRSSAQALWTPFASPRLAQVGVLPLSLLGLNPCRCSFSLSGCGLVGISPFAWPTPLACLGSSGRAHFALVQPGLAVWLSAALLALLLRLARVLAVALRSLCHLLAQLATLSPGACGWPASWTGGLSFLPLWFQSRPVLVLPTQAWGVACLRPCLPGFLRSLRAFCALALS